MEKTRSMTLKNVVAYKYSNAAILADAAQLVALYTVPAGKKFLLKEIIHWCAKTNPDTTLAIYVLKSGLADFTTGAIARGLGAKSIYAREVPDGCHVLVLDSNTDALEGFLAHRETVLHGGDALKLIAWPEVDAAAGAIQSMTFISGDEL